MEPGRAVPDTTAVSSLARTTMGEQLSLLILTRIVSGELPPGSTLPSEAELADTYQVSRPVVRETIRHLAAYGVVRIQHGKRTRILSPDHWDVLSLTVQEAYERAGRGRGLRLQVYEVRLILEGSAAALAAARATAEQCDQIDLLIREMGERVASQSSVTEFLTNNYLFHDTIAHASGNLPLRQLVRQTHGFLNASGTASRFKAEGVGEAAAQHRRISEAVLAGDKDEARKAAEYHVTWAQSIEEGSDPEN